jgi:hypothetical protein
VAEPILNAPRVVACVGERVAARMTQHVNVNRKGEACARADALDQPIDRIGRERTAALGGEDEGRIKGLLAQLTQYARVATRIPRPDPATPSESTPTGRASPPRAQRRS